MKQKDDNHKDKYDIKTILVISVSVLFFIVVYAPAELYVNNIDEFIFSMKDMLSVQVPSLVVSVAVLSAVLYILTRVSKRIYAFVVCALWWMYLCTILQGVFFSGKLPPLDGRDIDWSAYRGETVYGLILCVLVAVIIGSLYMNLRKVIVNIVRWSCIAVDVVCIVALFVMVSRNSVWGTDITYMNNTEKNICDYSTDQNYIIFLVDSVEGETVDNLLNDGTVDKKDFSDFTFYKNVVGAYPYTARYIPYILSGKWYECQCKFSDYLDSVVEESPLFEELRADDYELNLYDMSELPVNDKGGENVFGNLTSDRTHITSYSGFLKDVMMLGGIKYAPYALKKYCYSKDGNYNSHMQMRDEAKLFNWRNDEFMKKLESDGITRVSDKQFKFIHLEGAHVPFRYGSYENDVKAAMEMISDYLDILKENGVYDNSVIILMADHGYAVGRQNGQGRQNPMLLVKQKNEHHDMICSDLPVSYADLQVMYKRLLDGKSGDDLFDVNEDSIRERRYLLYELEDEDSIYEYMQTGNASDDSTMVATGREYSLDEMYKVPDRKYTGVYGATDRLFVYLNDMTGRLVCAILIWTLIFRSIMFLLGLILRVCMKHKKISAITQIMVCIVPEVLILAALKHAITTAAYYIPSGRMLAGMDMALPTYDNGWYSVSVTLLATAVACVVLLLKRRKKLENSECSDMKKYGPVVACCSLVLVLSWLLPVGMSIYWVATCVLAMCVEKFIQRSTP